jgi:hypothetical protein
MTELSPYEGAHCANCQTALQGEYCHHCGQSVHSVLQPAHGLIEEFFETFLHVDGRILHTVPALFAKPGFLTLEYFSGRRVRYIAPFRLMFVLCLLSFFTLHLATDLVSQRIQQRHQTMLLDQGDDFSELQTPQAVQTELNRKLATLEATRAIGNAAIVAQVGQAEQRLRQRAAARLTELGAPAGASTAQTPAGTPSERPEKPISPVHIRWLPEFANERLTAYLQRSVNSGRALSRGTPAQRQEAWDHLATGIYAELPGTMLVLVPLFALLLKLFYVFKRRLYMEHLIVSLHSHAFLFLSTLLLALTGMLSTLLKPHAAWVGYTVGMLQLPLMLWVPVYLLIMQKRVYRQGWWMTVVKYWCIGWLYFWLLLFTLSIAVMLGLAH